MRLRSSQGYAPGLRTQYAPPYYGGFLLDPDGKRGRSARGLGEDVDGACDDEADDDQRDDRL